MLPVWAFLHWKKGICLKKLSFSVLSLLAHDFNYSSVIVISISLVLSYGEILGV